MVRYLTLVILVSFPASPGRGQEEGERQRYVFQPTARSGDRFHSTNETRQTMKASRGKDTLINTDQTDNRVIEATVVTADKEGKPLEYRERTAKHERDQKMSKVASLASPSNGNVGPLQDVELEYTLQAGRYMPALRSGEASKELEIKLRSPRLSVLDEEFLPTVPLALGETQTISDPGRLKAIFNEFGPDTTFLKPMKITLAGVQKMKGTTYAVLKETVKVKTTMPVEGGSEVAVVLDIDITVAYDLDHGYLRQAKVKSSGTGKLSALGQVIDLKMSYASDTQTIKRKPESADSELTVVK